MGVRRVKSWERLADRSEYDYQKVPDADLLSMKAIARAYAEIFFYDGRGLFLEVLDKSGLSAINKELWNRGLTPAQRGKT